MEGTAFLAIVLLSQRCPISQRPRDPDSLLVAYDGNFYVQSSAVQYALPSALTQAGLAAPAPSTADAAVEVMPCPSLWFLLDSAAEGSPSCPLLSQDFLKNESPPQLVAEGPAEGLLSIPPACPIPKLNEFEVKDGCECTCAVSWGPVPAVSPSPAPAPTLVKQKVPVTLKQTLEVGPFCCAMSEIEAIISCIIYYVFVPNPGLVTAGQAGHWWPQAAD